MASLEEAITRRSPSGDASMSPAAPTSSTSTQRSASSVSRSTTSKSATSVSASSTSARASIASLGIPPPIASAPAWDAQPGPPTMVGPPRAAEGLLCRGPRSRPGALLVVTALIEAQRSGHYVFGHQPEGPVVAEGVGAQPDQGLADADPELGGDHAGGLVHHVVEVGTRLQFGGEPAGGGTGLEQEDGVGGDVGH